MLNTPTLSRQYTGDNKLYNKFYHKMMDLCTDPAKKFRFKNVCKCNELLFQTSAGGIVIRQDNCEEYEYSMYSWECPAHITIHNPSSRPFKFHIKDNEHTYDLAISSSNNNDLDGFKISKRHGGYRDVSLNTQFGNCSINWNKLLDNIEDYINDKGKFFTKKKKKIYLIYLIDIIILVICFINLQNKDMKVDTPNYQLKRKKH